jgi:hypothetical protein
MNFEHTSEISGKILWLEVRRKDGSLKTRMENVPNIILNAGLNIEACPTWTTTTATACHAMTSTTPNYEDLDGTWNQSGNTVTRATGSGTFPSSPSKIGDELYWFSAGGNTGHRCHVSARASDTSITVTGVAKTITGGRIRRFSVNASGASSTTGSIQTSASITVLSTTISDTSNTWIRRVRVNFNSAASAYTLGSFIFPNCSRVLLPSTIAIDAEDQIVFEYEVQETVSGRSQTYDLGAEATGIPTKYALTSIVGNGTNVDVTFTGATHFLAGDKLDLRGVVPRRFAISSASSNSTTFTINTTAAHGLSVSDSVVIEGASLAGYNGTFTVATVVDTDTITITDAANPGAMGASGTIRLATPGTYFDDLGLATIASMVSTSVARITSAITGPAVDTSTLLGGDPGCEYRLRRNGVNAPFEMLSSGSSSYVFNEANAKALADVTGTGALVTTGSTWSMNDTAPSNVAATFSSDFTLVKYLRKNAGAGTNITRLKQIYSASGGNGVSHQVTFNTPFGKATTQRLTISFSKQAVRALDLTGL